MKSRTTPEFWKGFQALPTEIQELARKNFGLWLINPRHPSLRFRQHANGKWSARVGLHYRAVAHFDAETFIWTWIGTHEDYNKF